MKSEATLPKFSIRAIVLTALLTALTAVLAQIAVPIPVSPVPLSLGMVAVYATGVLLRPRNALLAQVCYLLLGAFGLPVFGGFKGGLSALLGPTGGYLMVYPLMALLISFVLNRKPIPASEKRGPVLIKTALSIVVAHLLLYAGGTAWLSISASLSFEKALALGVTPYVVMDAAKIVLCVMVLPLLRRILASRGAL